MIASISRSPYTYKGRFVGKDCGIEEGPLGSVSRVFLCVILISLLLPAAAPAQAASRLRLEDSEVLFSTMAALNACGYDQDVQDSLPLRVQIRGEVQRAMATIDAQNALERLCKFYGDHRQGDAARTASQYISLALYLGEPPAFTPTVKEADLPPDAIYVLGFVPLLQNFYITAELHKVWLKHLPEYERLIEHLHGPVNDALVATDLYLRRPLSGYQQHGFVVYVELLMAPGQVNSRNYSDDYYMVLAPDAKAQIPVEKVRHTYLHYVFDPKTQQRAQTLDRLAPLLKTVKEAPMDQAYKDDVGLLLNESLIRAIEAHLLGGSKGNESLERDAVDSAMKEGFVLTRYFYDALTQFRKGEVGLDQAYPDWLHFIDLDREVKRANNVEFARTATPELVRATRKKVSMNDLAENALASRNADAAEKFAKVALENKEDPGRAMFILARASVLQKNIDQAKTYFEQTLQNTQDTHMIAWSHIYLGRIFDLKKDREAARQQYQAALDSKDPASDTRAAAEKGLAKP